MSAEVEPLTLPDAARTDCLIDGCGRPKRTRGWCAMHYQTWKRTGDPLGARCTGYGCSEYMGRSHVVRAAAVCARHYANPWAGQHVCPGCGSDDWTLLYAFGGDLWHCVACHVFFDVAADDERPAA